MDPVAGLRTGVHRGRGITEPSRPSHRYGLEFANDYAPRPWLILNGDVSWSRAHFTAFDPIGDAIPGSVATVISGGATLDSVHSVYGSLRLRYFGPRALVEDNSVRSKATSLIKLEGGYMFSKHLKLGVDVFNVLNARDSDIDYYYASRLPGEPSGGVTDIHLHPTLPRTARINLVVGFSDIRRGALTISVTVPLMSRDWWAVLIAAAVAALVKLGVIGGVPW